MNLEICGPFLDRSPHSIQFPVIAIIKEFTDFNRNLSAQGFKNVIDECKIFFPVEEILFFGDLPLLDGFIFSLN